MVFFVALSTLALVRAVRSGSTGWWLLYAIATCAAAYTHYTTIYVLGVQALWSLWACRDRLRQPLLAGALAVLLYVPWLPHLRARQGSDVIAFLAPLHVKSTLTDLAQVVAGYPFASLGQIPSLAGGVAIGACAALGIAALFRDRYQHVGAVREPGTRLALLVALALATPLGVLVYSVIVVDIFGARQLLASLPAAALVLGAMLAALPRPLTAIAAAMIAGVLVFGTIRALEPIHRRPALNQVAHFIDARAGTEAAVVYVPVFARTGPLAHDLDIYLHRPLYIAPTQSQLAAVWRNFREVFVVGYEYRGHLIGPAPPPSQHRRVLTRAEFDGIVHEVVTVYGAA
jgi:hypothetical protein